jgi:hypothetical protein
MSAWLATYAGVACENRKFVAKIAILEVKGPKSQICES